MHRMRDETHAINPGRAGKRHQSSREPAPTWLRRLALAGLALFAFVLCFYSGLRGLFPLDQSIVFDGAYRVLRGEVIYRDFVAPYGPVAFWYQALLFKIAGVNFYTYALGAALLNTLGALCAVAVLRRMFPDRFWTALAGGAITAAWLCAPFGTTYPEQTAFCLLLAALALILQCSPLAPRVDGASPDLIEGETASTALSTRGASGLLAAGVLAGIGLLAKHNAGLLAIGVCVVAVVVYAAPAWRRAAAHLTCFGTGAGVCLGVFLIWVRTCSDWNAFVYHVIELPRELGSQRLFGSAIDTIRALFTGKGSDEIRILLLAWWLLCGCVIGLGILNRRRLRAHDRQALRTALLAATFVGLQNVFSIVSSNNGTNEKPLLGVLFAVSVGLIAYLRSRQPDVGDDFDVNADRLLKKGSDPAANALPAEEHRSFERVRPLFQQAADWQRLPRWPIWVCLAATAGFSLWLNNGLAIGGALVASLLADSLGCFRDPAEGSWEDRIRSPLSPGFVTVATRVAFVYLLAVGSIVSIARQVHESFEHYHRIPHVFVVSHHSTFTEQFREPALRGLRWGDPTRVGEKPVTANDLRELMADLRARGGNFFTFPDFTFLYAALDVPSPQPLLWFHPGLTYPVQYTPEIDRRVVAALHKQDVRTIVLEGDNFFGTTQLDNFPELRTFIDRQFAFDRKIGIFSVYARIRNYEPTRPHFTPAAETATVAPDAPR
jgi:hypothetical protein